MKKLALTLILSLLFIPVTSWAQTDRATDRAPTFEGDRLPERFPYDELTDKAPNRDEKKRKKGLRFC